MLRSWVRFNAVGIVGLAVQLLVLAVLLRFGLHYLAATIVAVEAAVLQNFLWHERWTWSHRASVSGRARRLWRFHALNGLVSIVGNLAAMPLLVGILGLPPLPANLISVLLCSTLNFAAGYKLIWVMSHPGTSPRASNLGSRTSVLGLHPFDDNHLGL
jgi:putative flippase GtrA